MSPWLWISWRGGSSRSRAASSMRPASAWTSGAYAWRCAHGPSWPHPVIEQYTSRGLRREQVVGSETAPREYAGPEVLDEHIGVLGESARPAARRRRCAGRRRRRASLRSCACSTGSARSRAAAPRGCGRRRGASILMTSAPRSASTRPHKGPAITCDRSRTRTPASGAPSGDMHHRVGHWRLCNQSSKGGCSPSGSASRSPTKPSPISGIGSVAPAGPATTATTSGATARTRSGCRRRSRTGATASTSPGSRPRLNQWEHYRVVLDDVPDPLHPRPGKGAEPTAAGADARLAVDVLGLPPRDRAADRSGALRRRSGRRLRRGRARAAGLPAVGRR